MVCKRATGSSLARFSRSLSLISTLTEPWSNSRSQGVAGLSQRFVTLAPSRVFSTSLNEGWK